MKLSQARILIFDFETTGLDPETDKIVEVAAMLVDFSGKAHGFVNTLCNPGIPIPPKASSIHHVTDEMVEGYRPFDFKLFTDIDFNVFSGHNIIGFDNKFLPKHDYPMLDTMLLAKKVWPELESYSNQFIRYFKKTYLKDDVGRAAHDAWSDVVVTSTILLELFSGIKSTGITEVDNVMDMELEELIAWTLQPNLLKTCRFGNKHYGIPWSEVPQDYLQWMKSKCTLDADTELTVDHYLKQGKLFA